MLIVISVVVYLPALKNPFAPLDDREYVYGNPHVLAGLDVETLHWAFTTTEMGNWHPLTWISHALDAEIFGSEPAGHHFSSVALHAVNALLLFLFLASATGALGRSFAVALLFAVHPINVESVAWIAERKNVLSTAFFFATLLAYVWYVRKPDWRRYVLVAGLFVLGLAAKPMVVTLPFVALLLDYWPLRRVAGGESHKWRELALEKIPLIALAAVSSLLTIWAQRRAGAVSFFDQLPLTLRLQNAVYTYAAYAWKIIWPSKLGFLYLYQFNGLGMVKLLSATVFLLCISVLVIKCRRPYLIVGWLWFLGTLVPVIGIIQVGMQSMADRYAYIPEIGLFLILAWGMHELCERANISFRSQAAALGTVALALALLTVRQIGYWNTSLELWQHTAAVTPNNYVAEDKVALELMAAGRLDEAYARFENALRMNPSDALANFNLGARLHALGKMQEAIQHYEVTVAQHTSPQLLADGYENMGTAYRQLGDLEKARECYRRAIAYDPQRASASAAIQSIDGK